MSCAIPRCDRCNLDRVLGRVAPLANAQSYGVEWRCPHCDDHLLDICLVGPLVPIAPSCLNCGTSFPDLGDFAVCPGCGMTRLGTRDVFGLDPAPIDPVAAASKLFEAGLIRRAIATLNHALVAEPSLVPAWKIKYSFLSGLGLSEAALTVIKAAMAHVNDPELLISLGYTLQSLGRHSEAVSAYRNYLEQSPAGDSAGVALCNTANAMRALNNDLEAEQFYKKAIEKDPADSSYYANYGRLLFDQTRYAEAHAIIDKGWQRAREPAVVRRLLEDKALVFAEQQRGEDALKCIDAAIEQGADGIRAHYLRGRALALLGRLSESRECMQRVLKIDSTNADARRALKMIDEAAS